jgi:hypothetical protein
MNPKELITTMPIRSGTRCVGTVLVCHGLQKLNRQILDNRIMILLASGILGTSAELLERVARCGAGAVTSKSCGPAPRAGHPNPTVLDWGHGLINAVHNGHKFLLMILDNRTTAMTGHQPHPGSEHGPGCCDITSVSMEEVVKKCDSLIDLHCGDGNETSRHENDWRARIEFLLRQKPKAKGKPTT